MKYKFPHGCESHWISINFICKNTSRVSITIDKGKVKRQNCKPKFLKLKNIRLNSVSNNSIRRVYFINFSFADLSNRY